MISAFAIAFMAPRPELGPSEFRATVEQLKGGPLPERVWVVADAAGDLVFFDLPPAYESWVEADVMVYGFESEALADAFGKDLGEWATFEAAGNA